MGWYFLSRIFAAGLTLVTLVVLTRALDPEGFGSYNMVILAATTAFAFLFAWVPAVIIRFHSAAEFGGRATAWALGAGAFFALALLPVLGAGYFLVPPAWQVPLLLGALYCLTHCMNEFGLSGLRVYDQGPAFAAGVVLRPIVGVALALGLVYLGWGYEGAVIGMAMGSLATGLYALNGVIRRSGIGLPSLPPLKTFLAFGIPLAVVSSNSMVLVLITQTTLARAIDLAAVGVYAAAQTLALRAITMPMMTLTRATAATIFQAFEEKGHAAADVELERHFSFLMLVSAPLVAPMVLANDTVAQILFDERFREEVARHLAPLSLAAFISGVQGSYFAYAFLLSRRTSVQFVIMAGGAVVHAGLALAFIFGFGAIGASYAILASSVLSLSAYLLVGRVFREQRLSAVEVRKAGVALLAMAPFCLAADQVANPVLALGFVALGGMAFCLALYLQRQIAMEAAMGRIRRIRRSAKA